MTYGREGIYLDHAATTPVDPAVVAVMTPLFTAQFGNPSSIYRLGQEARGVLDGARRTVAGVLGVRPSEVLFTSGATESDNLALRGVVEAARRRDGAGVPHVIVSAIEHHAVLDAAQEMADQGMIELDVLPVDAAGIIDPAVLDAAIRQRTCLVGIVLANNEIGSVQPIVDIRRVTRQRGVPLLVDAVQAPGLLPLDMFAIGADLLSLSAHKFYGPKGVGVLVVRRDVPIVWGQRGGGQESGRRGGTENVPLIVGMAEALRRADELRDAYTEHCRTLRDRLWIGISAALPDAKLNGPPFDGPRLANNLNVTFPGVQGETLLLSLDMMGVAASAGSACTTGNTAPSHVLLAIGRDDAEARASVRFTVGRGNSLEEMDDAVDAVTESVQRIRQLSVASV